MPERGSGANVTIVAAVLALVGTIGGAVIGNWEKLFPDDSATTTVPASNTTSVPVISAEVASTVADESPGTAVIPSDVCYVTIENPLVALKEEPVSFSNDIMRVPSGDHAVTATTIVSFAGNDDRWMKVSVNGQAGWIRDSIILVAAKSPACGF